jgi:hypothetical protein
LKLFILLSGGIFILFICIFHAQETYLELKGPYLGQKPPEMTPTIFAPGIVSKPESRACVSSDGNYLFFTSDRNGSMDTWWVDAGVFEKLKTQH